ncbi:MAG: hypothetical protein PHE29_13965 [Tissierellia bacterium]|nr:hypothetical protein [Tissierellia bacterium]MDD4779042.1 hypothetical protein [Tissierellia bacterium]
MNKKLLIGIKKCLETSLIDINNLNDCINKNCWYDIVEYLIKDISQAIKIENIKNK